MAPGTEASFTRRLRNFFVSIGVALLFVYGFLPLLTGSFDILSSMSEYLEETGIDPSRYFYTDVEQVAEAEHYLQSVLETE
jgi:hypothetical protein